MYDVILSVHYVLSRLLLISGLSLFLIALIQAQRKKDAQPWLRKLTYVITGIITLQASLGFIMYFDGGRPLDPDIHMVYGIGAMLVLPFFVYVEMTAEKRPAIGSYVLAGLILAGLIARGILTGR